MKFVRVEVEHRRTFAGIDIAQCAPEETTWQQAKIAAAGDRKAEPANVPGSQRVFIDRAGWSRDLEGVTGCFRDTVANVW
jgi:hypothetical protein